MYAALNNDKLFFIECPRASAGIRRCINAMSAQTGENDLRKNGTNNKVMKGNKNRVLLRAVGACPCRR